MLILRDRFIRTVVITTVAVVFLMGTLRLLLRSGFLTGRRSSGQELRREASVELPPPGPFRIKKVIDGDTLILENGAKVRLLGIDTPEIHHPELPVQRFGEEAAEYLRKLVEDSECTLEYETSRFRDGYGRLLAYVFVNGRLVNAEMVRRGYAYAYTRFPFQYQEMFLALEREARQNQYGLWNFSLRDGRIARLVGRYEALNPEGRQKLEEILERLVREYPLSSVKPGDISCPTLTPR